MIRAEVIESRLDGQHGDDQPRRPVRPGHRQQHRDDVGRTRKQADLSVTKTVNDPTPNVGETIAYTITLTDNGPSNATNVTLQDVLPAGLTFVSANPGQGAYDPATGIWTVGSVANGSSAVLTIQATVVSPNPTTNFATHHPLRPVRPQPGEQHGQHDRDAAAGRPVRDQGVDNAAPNVGDTITFIVSVGDNGPEQRDGVVGGGPPAGGRDVRLGHAQPRELTTPLRGPGRSGRSIHRTAQTLVIQATVTSPNPSTNTRDDHRSSDQFDPVHRQQHGQRHRDAAAGRPGAGQDRQQPDPQRRRHDHATPSR